MAMELSISSHLLRTVPYIFKEGDFNGDGKVDIVTGTAMINVLFISEMEMALSKIATPIDMDIRRLRLSS